MARNALLPLALALVAFAAGCAAPITRRSDTSAQIRSSPSHQAARDEDRAQLGADLSRRMRTAVTLYFKNRTLDFLDTFEVGVSGGTWARVEVQYLLGTWGVGATGGQRWRLGQRSFVVEEETVTLAPFPFPVGAVLYFLALPLEPWPVVFFGGSGEQELAIWPDPLVTGIAHTVDRLRIACVELRGPDQGGGLRVGGDSFMVGAEACLLVGVRARVMPVQILDFVAGVFGWDLLHDDTKGNKTTIAEY